MPPRDPELPEGTDQIITGAGSTDDGGSSSGFVASSGGSTPATTSTRDKSGSTGGSGGRSTTEKLGSQLKDQVMSLRGQATDRLRGMADDGKGRATGLLDEVASVIDDAARSIDERLGGEYADYARRASGAVSSFAQRIRDKDVDDLLDDTRDMVRKSPTIAIAAAAVIGFALMRVVRTGLDEDGGSDGRRASGSTGGGA